MSVIPASWVRIRATPDRGKAEDRLEGTAMERAREKPLTSWVTLESPLPSWDCT